MRKIFLIFLILISSFGTTGCNNIKKEEITEAQPKIVKATLNENGDIIINENDITEEATFLNYEIDDITIGFIVVRGTDGIVRVAFNTCQSCSPSPNAYFIQKGQYFICQNCLNKFHVDQIGVEQGGCNPAPVEELFKKDDFITIPADYVETYKDKFENWNGPKA